MKNDKRSESEPPVNSAKDNDPATSVKQVKATAHNGTNSCEKTNAEKVFERDSCTYETNSDNGIKIHKAKKHTHTTMMSPAQNRVKFSPRCPQRPPPRFPQSFPPFPMSPYDV